jgi:hypothetical protein
MPFLPRSGASSRLKGRDVAFAVLVGVVSGVYIFQPALERFSSQQQQRKPQPRPLGGGAPPTTTPASAQPPPDSGTSGPKRA